MKYLKTVGGFVVTLAAVLGGGALYVNAQTDDRVWVGQPSTFDIDTAAKRKQVVEAIQALYPDVELPEMRKCKAWKRLDGPEEEIGTWLAHCRRCKPTSELTDQDVWDKVVAGKAQELEGDCVNEQMQAMEMASTQTTELDEAIQATTTGTIDSTAVVQFARSPDGPVAKWWPLRVTNLTGWRDAWEAGDVVRTVGMVQ